MVSPTDKRPWFRMTGLVQSQVFGHPIAFSGLSAILVIVTAAGYRTGGLLIEH